MKAQSQLFLSPWQPLWRLLYPHKQPSLFVVALIFALLTWGIGVWQMGMPLWGATTLALALLAGPVALKWHNDRQRYGTVISVLGILLYMQGFHTIEHFVQALEYYFLGWSPFRSSGLISSLNAEWIHFTWNWLVVAGLLYLMKHGCRNLWAWLLLVWAVAHSLEHTYLFIRYLQIKQNLLAFGLSEPAVAQALPGILGRDGWIAQNYYCTIPGLTTASRISVHFWWNMGEITLLVLMGKRFLEDTIRHTQYAKMR